MSSIALSPSREDQHAHLSERRCSRPKRTGFTCACVPPPHGGVLIEPKKRIADSHIATAHVADKEIRSVHQFLMADDTDDGFMGHWRAVGTCVKIEIVQADQVRQSLEV